MKEIDEIVKWEENRQGGIQYMKDFAEPHNWEIYRNYYRGKFLSGQEGKRKYSVALIFSILRSMLPRIYFTNPQVVVTNEKPGFYLKSKIVQKIDNKMIRKTKIKTTFKDAILEAGLCGTVPILTGFDTEYGYDPRFKEKILDERTGEEVEIGGTLLQFDKKSGDKLEYDEMIKPGRPWAETQRPEYFIVPYGYSRLWKVPWVMRMYVRHLDDVKRDPRLVGAKDIKANGMSTFDWLKEDKLHIKMPSQNYGDFVFLWEIRDLKSGRLMIMQEGNKKFLYNEKDELQKYGNPYFELTFNYDDLTFWGLPDAKFLEDQQLAINETRTLHMEHRRISKLRFIYDENIMHDDEIQKLVTEDTGTAIKANGDVDKGVKVFQPYVPPDFNVDVEAIRKDAREISGFSRNQVGEFEGGRRTATESNIVNMASQIRVSERKDIVADLLVDIVQKYNKYIFSQWNVQQVEDIVGPDGTRYWVTFSYKDIESDYTFRVDPESGMPVSSEQKKQEAIAVAQYIHNSPLVAMALQAGQQPPYNLEALDRYVLSQFEGVPIEEIMPATAGAGRNPEQPIPLQALEQKLMAQGGGENAPV
jgi:hypothetical protein